VKLGRRNVYSQIHHVRLRFHCLPRQEMPNLVDLSLRIPILNLRTAHPPAVSRVRVCKRWVVIVSLNPKVIWSRDQAAREALDGFVAAAAALAADDATLLRKLRLAEAARDRGVGNLEEASAELTVRASPHPCPSPCHHRALAVPSPRSAAL
jgi:hypothetical protein